MAVFYVLIMYLELGVLMSVNALRLLNFKSQCNVSLIKMAAKEAVTIFKSAILTSHYILVS